MPVKRELWKENFSELHVPNWHCPLCAGGYLKHKPNALHFWETCESRKASDYEDSDPECIEYRFSTILICNNDSCQEPVVVSGTGQVVLVHASGRGDDDVYLIFFNPKFVNPSPALIQLSPKCPVEVIAELQKSFVSSWFDYSAAGNHIRAAVERLLDHLNEPSTKIGKAGKEVRLTLHERIVGIAQRDKKLSDNLLAVKWLGNAASHSDELTQDDVYDALNILESVLADLFTAHEARLMSLVAEINKMKGPQRTERED